MSLLKTILLRRLNRLEEPDMKSKLAIIHSNIPIILELFDWARLPVSYTPIEG
jgi:hypothetical protein